MKKSKTQTTGIEAKAINLSSIKTSRIDLEIEGMNNLVCNRFSEAAKKQIEDKQQQKGSAATAQEARDPKRECEGKLYRLNGILPVKWEENYLITKDLGYPTIAFKNAFVNAASFLGNGITKVQLRGMVHILGDLVPLKWKQIRMREDRVVIGRRITTIAYRPEFIEWECKLPIFFNQSLTNPEQIAQIFEYAGFHVGIGDWRPQKNGQFGTFRVKRTRK